MLALLDADSDDDKKLVFACSFCLRQRRVEPAGHAFHDVHEKPLLEGKRRGKTRAQENEGSDDERDAPADSSWKKKRREGGDKKGGALKLSPALEGVDLYTLLEVSESASTDQVKKQYRKLALKHHPDKKEASGKSPGKNGLTEEDLLFVQIQEAYEVLSDQSKRRQYDSSLDFDDDTPDEVDSSLGFYGTFAPVFKRNSRWSNRLPVPELGDDSTDIAKVHKFYDFWYNFDSWRDFSKHDEYNVEDAEFREEKRWMDRQNQKIRKKYQDAERRRILRLVEDSERLDPRIRAEKEAKEAKKREEKERRARAKQEEEEAKRRAEEERKQREEQEKADKEERERQEREQRKQNKEIAKRLRQRLKKYVQARCKLNATDLDELQELGLSYEAEALEVLCDKLEALKSDKEVEAALRKEIAEWKSRKASEDEEQERKRQEARRRDEQKAMEAKGAAAAAACGAEWSTEELGLLAKALQKFPGGTGGRWAQISQLLHACGCQRTEQEVVAKTKELSEGQSLRSMGSRLSQEWSQGGKGVAQPKAKAGAAASPNPPTSAAAQDGRGKTATASTGESPSAPEAAAAATTAAPAPEAGGADWSSEQQKAFEAALQKYPTTLDKNERWRLIAEAVPGKTKAQCVERFKFLRSQLSSQSKG